MTTLSLRSSVNPATERAPSSSLARLFAAAVTEWRTRQASRHVEALSDLMLHDIGISRGEIDIAVRRGRRGLG